jgi:hypothetical protein
MKRNLLIAIAVTAFMLATTIAQAADFEFSGKFRPRFEIQGDGNSANSSRPQWDTRARLNAKAKVNAILKSSYSFKPEVSGVMQVVVQELVLHRQQTMQLMMLECIRDMLL